MAPRKGNEQTIDASVPLTGTWYLFEADRSPRAPVPAHRVEIVFEDDATGLHGRIGRQIAQARFSGSLACVQRDGGQLSIQIAPRADHATSELPVLVLHAVDRDRFQGHWMKMAEVLGPRLQLVRAGETA